MESCSETRLKNIALTCAAMTAVISGVALAGWMTKWLIFASIRPYYIPMAPSTALCFIMLSGVLLIHLSSPQRFIGRICANAGIFAVWLICLIILIEFFAGRLPEMEHSIFGPTGSLGHIPIGYMSPITAFSLILACLSELLLLITATGQQRTRHAAAYIAATLVLVGFVMVLGYLYGTPVLYGGTIIPVALPTSIVLFFMGAGLLAASGEDAFPVRLFMGPSVRSRLMRAFFPVAIFAILFAGWLDAAMMLPFMKNHALTSSLVAIISAVIFGIIITKLSDAIGSSIDRSASELKRAERELFRVNRALKTLSECNQTLVRSMNETDLLRDICRIIVEFGGYRMALVGCAEQDAGKTVRAMASAGYEEGFFKNAHLTWADTESGRGPIGTAIRTRAIAFFRNVISDEYPPAWREAALKRGYVCSVGLPLISETELLGALAIYASDPDAFDEQEIGLLTELSLDLSYGIASLRTRAERERAEEAIRGSEERYKQLLESITNYNYTVRMEQGRPVSTIHGGSCVSVTGYAFEDFNADPYLWYNMIHEEDRGKVVRRIEKTLAEGSASSIEHRIFRKDGTLRWVQDTLVPKYDQQRRLVAYDGLVIDITERRSAEESVKKYSDKLEEKVRERTKELEQKSLEIERARSEAEAANKAKSDFLANMSHELRTPLNSILGFSEVLQDGLHGPINEKQKGYLDYIHSSGNHLLAIINDILDLAKVESGMLELQVTRVTLAAVLQDAMTMLKEKAMKHRIAMALAIEPGATIEINIDERKLKQIIFNLLSNAVKFTPDGGSVRVAARRVRSGEFGVGSGGKDSSELGARGFERKSIYSELRTLNTELDVDFIEISVADTGIGIKPEDLNKLFKPFSQLESAYTKTYEGTGLGLDLTKRLVEFLGGRIRVESEFNKGSTFTFVIPIQVETLPGREGE